VVRHRGATGRFDDVVGRGFALVSPTGDPAAGLAPELAAWFAGIQGFGAHVAPGAPVDDVNGGYARWFAGHAAEVALVRPDFAVFGTAPRLADASGLLAELRRRLGSS
jgi:hypothetical protein